MSKEKDDSKRAISREELAAYLNEKMSAEEMHAFEKRALDSAFETEAMEGLETLTAQELDADLKALDKRLAPKSGKNFWMGPLRIAAAVTLLLSFVWLIYFINQQDNFRKEDLSLQQPAITEEALAADELEEATENDIEEPKSQEVLSKSFIAQAEPETQIPSEEKEIENIEVTTPALIDDKLVAASAEAKEIRIAEAAAKDIEMAAADNAKLAKRSTLRASEAVSSASSSLTRIRGKVTSADDGAAMPGVNIVLKGTNTGTITDAQGNYQIETTEAEPTLVFSFIGVLSKEVKANVQTDVNVELESDVNQLSEVVVTGYGISGRNEVYPTVQLASPLTGKKAFQQYLESNAHYPASAAQSNLSGRVVIDITIEPDGSISNYEIFRSLSKDCDEELIRLIKEGPQWKPSALNNIPYRDKVRIRLKFPARN